MKTAMERGFHGRKWVAGAGLEPTTFRLGNRPVHRPELIGDTLNLKTPAVYEYVAIAFHMFPNQLAAGAKSRIIFCGRKGG